MGNVWRFVLELEPVAKGRPRFGNGRTYTPAKTREFENSVRALLSRQYWGVPLKGPLSVAITFLFPRPKKLKHPVWHIVKSDLDNLVKAACDPANGIVWEDDCQICELRAYKKYAPEGKAPHIIMQVCHIEDAQ